MIGKKRCSVHKGLSVKAVKGTKVDERKYYIKEFKSGPIVLDPKGSRPSAHIIDTNVKAPKPKDTRPTKKEKKITKRIPSSVKKTKEKPKIISKESKVFYNSL